MTTYARIINGLMVERIDPFYDQDGKEVPIVQRFHPSFVSLLTEIDPNNPPPVAPPAAPIADWRPDAMTAFYIQRKARMDVLTAMQMDYTALGQTDNAAACLLVKQTLKDLENSAEVLTVYNDQTATRNQYTAVIKNQWNAAIATVPTQVKYDFIKYGGNTT